MVVRDVVLSVRPVGRGAECGRNYTNAGKCATCEGLCLPLRTMDTEKVALGRTMPFNIGSAAVLWCAGSGASKIVTYSN